MTQEHMRSALCHAGVPRFGCDGMAIAVSGLSRSNCCHSKRGLLMKNASVST